MSQIIILEDEQDRVDLMRPLLQTNYPRFSIHVFDRSEQMIDYLKEHLGEAVFISLDHDLPLYRDAEGQLCDHGNGREVADFLATQEPVCTVGVHSTNVPAATGMELALNETGWTTFRLTPCGHLAWIEEAWWPLVADSIEV